MTEAIICARRVVSGVIDRHTAAVVEDHAVLVRDGVIVALGSPSDLQRQSPRAEVASYPRHMMLPGFVNAHHHVGLTPLQLGSPDHALELWFATRISARTIESYLDTLYSAFEMLASGVTTVQHIQGWMPGSLDQIHAIATDTLRAYRTIGMRASYCWGIRQQNRLVYEQDHDFCARLPTDLGNELAASLKAQAIPFDDTLALFDRLTSDNSGQSLTRIQLCPANLHWVTDEQLLAITAKARSASVPMHMHLLETPYQKEYALRRTGTTAVRHLHRLGVLGPHLTLGHGVWLNEADIEVAADTGTCICHNCSSNFRLRSGIAPINRFEAKGIAMGIGLDEAGINDDRDMLQEMRLVLRAHRTPGMTDEVPTCPQVLRMATADGARTTPFGDTIGKLEPGRRFDAVLIDYERATYPYQDEDVPPLDALIQRAKTETVDAVYVDGNVVYADGRFTNVDRDAVLREIADRLARPRTPEELRRRALGRAVTPYVKAFYDDYIGKADRRPFYDQSSRT